MVDTDYIVRSGFIVAFILIHVVMLATKILLALLLILIYIIIFGGDLFLSVKKFGKEAALEVVDADIELGEETLIVSLDIEGPSGGYIPKNYYLDLGIYDGEELVAEVNYLLPAGKLASIEMEGELLVDKDLAGKTLTIAGEVTLMILFIPIPLNKLPEENLGHVEFIFPDQDIVFGKVEVVEEVVE